MTPEERERVKAFVADPNGPVPRKARPADGVQRRRAPIDPRTARRERAADKWLLWFERAMREGKTKDPATVLPDAFAELEQKLADTIRELERIAKTGTIVCWKTDAAAFKAIPVMSGGSDGAILDVRPFLQEYHNQVGGES
jgi:hypothetical protein